MLQLTSEETRLKQAIEDALARFELNAQPVLKTLSEPLREYLDGDHALAQAVRFTEGHLRCAFAYSNDLGENLPGDLDASLEDTSVAWASYSPLCPEPAQRNRIVTFTPSQVVGWSVTPVLQKYGLLHDYQVRVLVCDGPSFLAWVGGFREEAFTEREIAKLDLLVPALKHRLVLERRLETAELTSRALDVVLERIGAPAFILASNGRVAHANAAGWTQLAAEGPALPRRLADAVCKPDSCFDVHPFQGPGLGTEHLVIARTAGGPIVLRVRHAAVRWGLTARQGDVLRLLAAGHSNAVIAAELGISPRTVEIHVTALFDRAGCDSRAALIAALFALEAG